MKKIMIGLLSLMLTIAVTAKENESKSTSTTDNAASVILVGTISDANSGELLVGVEVKIEGMDKKAYSDFDGKFAFYDISPGKYNILATYISYEKNKISDQVVDVLNTDLKLELKPLE